MVENIYAFDNCWAEFKIDGERGSVTLSQLNKHINPAALMIDDNGDKSMMILTASDAGLIRAAIIESI
jgi:hypothetical protein